MTTAAAQLELFGPMRVKRKPLSSTQVLGLAIGIFNASRPVQGTIGERWFVSRRLEVPSAAIVRYHPSLKCGDGRAPGLVWKLVDLRTGEACGVLRVFLDPETGWAVSKKALGRVAGATLNRAPRPP